MRKEDMVKIGKTALSFMIAALTVTQMAAGGSFFEDVTYLSDPLAGVRHKVVYLSRAVTAEPPALDGKLDDAVWKEAERLTGFLDSLGREPKFAADALIARGQDALYITTKMKYPIPGDLPEVRQSLGNPRVAMRYSFNPNVSAWDRVTLHINGGGDAWLRGEPVDKTAFFRGYIVPKVEPKKPGTAVCRRDGDTVVTEAIVPFEMVSDERPGPGAEWGFDLECRGSEFVRIPGSDQYQIMGAMSRWGAFLGDSQYQIDKWGRIYFGSQEDREEALRPPVVRVYVDRDQYANTDEAGEGYVEVLPGSAPLAALSLALELQDEGGKVVETISAGELKSGAIGVNLAPKPLAHGKYALVARVSTGGKVIATAQRQFERYPGEKLPKPRFREIPIKLFNDPRLGEAIVPVAIGIPLPMDLARDTSAFVLQRNVGPSWKPVWETVPAQFDVRARWHRNGSIKWVGVSFEAEYRQGWPAGHRMLWQGEEQPAPVEQPMTVREDESSITVVTGPARFLLSKTAFRLIEGAWLDTDGDGKFSDSEQLIRAGANDGVWYENHTKARMSAAHAETTVKTVESGPMRTVVAAEGWYVGDGTRECIHKTRLFFARGRATVKIKHTWINTADSRKTRVRDISLRVGVPGVRQYAFGSEDGTVFSGGVPQGGVYQLQLRSNHFVIETAPGQAIVPEGGRMGGWLYAATGRGGVSLAGRNLWKLYPKELAVSPDGVALHLWPVHGREVFPRDYQLHTPNLIKLPSAHQGRELDFQMPEAYYEELGRRWHTDWQQALKDNPQRAGFGPFIFWKAIRGYRANAQGVAMSVEADLTLHAPTAGPKAARRCAAILAANPHGVAGPRWTRYTDVVGPLHEKDTKRFGQVERLLEDVFDRAYIRQAEEMDDYGMLNWPDYHTYVFNAWRPSARAFHRCWVNSHYQEPRMCYLLYLRSGEGKYWRYATAKFCHATDVDAVNYGDDPPIAAYHQRGSTYHCKGILHWGGNGAIQAHMVNYDYLLLDYYLTGDPRGPDFVRMWAQEICRDVYVGEAERETAAPLSEAIAAYQHLRDPRLLKYITWGRDAMLSSPMEMNMSLPDYNYLLWWRMHKFTADPRVKERIVEQWGDGSKRKRHGLGHGLLTYLGYKFTGDKRVLYQAKLPDKPGSLHSRPRYTVSHPVAYTLGTAPYLMTAMDEIGATGDTMFLRIDATGWKTFWADDVERWREEGKKVWGRDP